MMPTIYKVSKPRLDDPQSRARIQAAAWAWYEHGGGSGKSGRRNYRSEQNWLRHAGSRSRGLTRPSRFKIEANGKKAPALLPGKDKEGRRRSLELPGSPSRCSKSDCGSSLFDSFELVAMSKQLEYEDYLSGATTLEIPKTMPVEGGAARTHLKFRVETSTTAKVAEKSTSPDAPSSYTRHAARFHFRPFCSSVEVVSGVHATQSRLQSERKLLTHRARNVHDNSLDKQHSSPWMIDDQIQPPAGIHEFGYRKEKSHHSISFGELGKVFHYVSHLPHHLLENHYHHHHIHYHHHHHYFADA